MRIISPEWANFSKGYQAVRVLEGQALQNWQAKWEQSVAFARQQGLKRAKELLQFQIENEKKTVRGILILLAAVVMLLALMTFLADSYPAFKWVFYLAGAVNFLQSAVLLIPIIERLRRIAALAATDPPPEDPHATLELTEKWWQGVSSQSPNPPAGPAELGEFNLLHYFAENLPNDYLAVRNPLLTASLGVDILILGPTGIWLFEVRNWRGLVTCRNGIWQHEPPADSARPSDRQWLEMRDQLEKALSLRLARNARFGPLIHGGLVFTHPNVQLDIDATSKANYGTPPQWLNRIGAAGRFDQFSTEVQFLVLDALLDYALSLAVSRPAVRSALDLAQLLYGGLLEDLRAYILRQVRSRLAGAGSPK